jgi:hypothetical protein
MAFSCNARVYQNILLSGCALPPSGECAPGEVELGDRCIPDDRRLDYLRCFHRNDCDNNPEMSASACEALGACDRALCDFDAVTEFELSRLQCVPSVGTATASTGPDPSPRAPLEALDLKDLSTRHYDFRELTGPMGEATAFVSRVADCATPTVDTGAGGGIAARALPSGVDSATATSLAVAASAWATAAAAAQVAKEAFATQAAAVRMEVSRGGAIAPTGGGIDAGVTYSTADQ